MKPLSRIAFALSLCFFGLASLINAETTPGLSPSRLLRNSHSDQYDVSDNSIRSTTRWNWIDFANFSSIADYEAFRFEIPEIFQEKGPKGMHRRLQEEELLVQEESTADDFNPNDLIVSVTFSEIYKVIIFIAIAWLLGNLSVKIGLPTLVGELVTGVVLGPPLLDFVPFPGALVLTGNLGLIGLILESGISLDVVQLQEVGSRALLLAIAGSVIPLATGFGIGRWIGMSTKAAIAVGAAFAPSSLGVASNALSSGDVLNTPIGQTIVASSVFDDVFGLILLSILEVFAAPDPRVFDYILPFISSFGYLIVLGFLGITVFPRVIENNILPLVSEPNRDQLAMVLMLVLTICYMLALNYSRASYLTGVFLAGLTFSQLHMVHASFVKHGRPMLNWLLRIFFAATIGFQVPVTRFSDVYVLGWGFALLLVVLAKVPVGFLVPHFQKEIPKGFPYNPYFRDIVVTSLAMTCRGEFNVIVASYALSEGLFEPEIYSAVILAILFGSIVSPLVLTRVLRYYNGMSVSYLEGDHPIERIGNTCDGSRPLFLAIQARTPVHWNLQEDFKRRLEEHGLIIIDHRSWHTLGRKDIGQEAVDITELFAQDTKQRVRVAGCFPSQQSSGTVEDESSIGSNFDRQPSSSSIGSDFDRLPSSTRTSDDTFPMDFGPGGDVGWEEERRERMMIEDRCEAIKQVMADCLKSDSPDDYRIQVSQWEPFIVNRKAEEQEEEPSELQPHHALRRRFYTFGSFRDDEDSASGDNPDPCDVVSSAPSNDSSLVFENTKPKKLSLNLGPKRPSIIGRSASAVAAVETPTAAADGPLLSAADLWENDNACRQATRDGFTFSPDSYGYGGCNVTIGLGDVVSTPNSSSVPRARHRRAVSFDPNIMNPRLQEDVESFVIKDRLHGYVRHHHPQSMTPQPSQEFTVRQQDPQEFP
ncbi:unnamed protein product [Cylindrotheca closterium]|uniref:Cation/H+ exchanger transmembrane domain-containing protein n=1 Tax=Cylindrotheca closterium TaxID=2856 RepID=A0AAD2CQH2_9STRA|nr:unnamed protein product [Cylindrotheca closterium]